MHSWKGSSKGVMPSVGRLTKVSVSFVLIFAVVLQGWAAAGSGMIYLAVGGDSFEKGAHKTVEIRVTPGQNIDTVEATVSFDPTKLEFVATDATDSAFPDLSEQVVNYGSVLIVRSSNKPIQNDALVASITLKAIATSSSTAVQISGEAAFRGRAVSLASKGANITFGQSDSGQATGAGSADGVKSNPSQPAQLAQEKHGAVLAAQTTLPQPTHVKVTTEVVTGIDITQEAQFDYATVVVKGQDIAEATVRYGLDAEHLTSNATFVSATDGLLLELNSLQPGTVYYYQATILLTDGTTKTGPVQLIKTKGYTVRLTVLGVDGSLLGGYDVTLSDSQIISPTDASGRASFANLRSGDHQIIVSGEGSLVTAEMTVRGGFRTDNKGIQTAPAQNITIKTKLQSSAAERRHMITATVVVGLILAAILISRWSSNRIARKVRS